MGIEDKKSNFYSAGNESRSFTPREIAAAAKNFEAGASESVDESELTDVKGRLGIEQKEEKRNPKDLSNEELAEEIGRLKAEQTTLNGKMHALYQSIGSRAEDITRQYEAALARIEELEPKARGELKQLKAALEDSTLPKRSIDITLMSWLDKYPDPLKPSVLGDIFDPSLVKDIEELNDLRYEDGQRSLRGEINPYYEEQETRARAKAKTT